MPARNSYTIEDLFSGRITFFMLSKALRQKTVKEVAVLILETLSEQGPLPVEAIRYHVNRVNHIKLDASLVSSVLAQKPRLFFTYSYLEDDNPSVYMTKDDNPSVYTTKEQHERHEAWGEIPEDYAHAYYELATYLKLVQQNPEYASAPLEQLRTLGVI